MHHPRIQRRRALAILGAQPLIDVRSPRNYTGKRTLMPDYPEEEALQAGHIPTAVHIPLGKAADESGRCAAARNWNSSMT